MKGTFPVMERCKMPCILLFSAEFVRKLQFPNNSIVSLLKSYGMGDGP
jgi:hypothetical protein